MPQIDWGTLQDELYGALAGALGNLAEEGIEDIRGPVRNLAERLAIAVRREDQRMIDALKLQLRALVEENEIRVRAESRGILDWFLEHGLDLVAGAAQAGVRSLIPGSMK